MIREDGKIKVRDAIEMMDIEIMVLVGSNKKASACVKDQLGWGDLADNIADYEGSTVVDPDASDRITISLTVPVPQVSRVEIQLGQINKPDETE